MNKTTQLIIRACKHKEPYKRLESVYRRFYCGGMPDDKDIINILSSIVDDYCPLNTLDIIANLDSSHIYNTNIDIYTKRCIRMLVSRIRLTGRKKFPGLIPPLKFRQ